MVSRLDTDRPRPDSPDGTPEALAGGRLLTAISNGIVKLMREHYGRGPVRAKTYILDDLIVCVLRGSGFTPFEQTMMDSDSPGRVDRVVEMRTEFQSIMGASYRDLIEQLTGRRVVAFMSQAHLDPDITLEVFFIDRPLPGFTAFGAPDADETRTHFTGPSDPLST